MVRGQARAIRLAVEENGNAGVIEVLREMSFDVVESIPASVNMVTIWRFYSVASRALQGHLIAQRLQGSVDEQEARLGRLLASQRDDAPSEEDDTSEGASSLLIMLCAEYCESLSKRLRRMTRINRSLLDDICELAADIDSVLTEFLGPVRRVLSSDEFERMVRRGKENTVSNDAVVRCPICLLEVDDETQRVRLPCGHGGHLDCMRTWLTEKCRIPLCPLCRADICTSSNGDAAAAVTEAPASGDDE